MVFITIVTGAYKPTYNVWGPHIARLAIKMRPSLQLSERQMITWLVLAPGMIIKLLSFNNPGAPKKYKKTTRGKLVQKYRLSVGFVWFMARWLKIS